MTSSVTQWLCVDVEDVVSALVTYRRKQTEHNTLWRNVEWPEWETRNDGSSQRSRRFVVGGGGRARRFCGQISVIVVANFGWTQYPQFRARHRKEAELLSITFVWWRRLRRLLEANRTFNFAHCFSTCSVLLLSMDKNVALREQLGGNRRVASKRKTPRGPKSHDGRLTRTRTDATRSRKNRKRAKLN